VRKEKDRERDYRWNTSESELIAHTYWRDVGRAKESEREREREKNRVTRQAGAIRK